MKKILSIILAALLLFSLTACGDDSLGKYEKKSENELYFYSSDDTLDTFLNDYYKRHSRSSLDYAINAMELGSADSSWKDWESMSLLWFDSTARNFRRDSFSLIRQWIYNVPVDDYGYVWTADKSEKVTESPQGNNFGMGWPFPNYGSNPQNDWEFNSNGVAEGWEHFSNGTSTTAPKTIGAVEYYVYSGMYSFYTENATEVGYVKDVSGTPNASLFQTADNPFLEFDLRWVVDGGSFEDGKIDDIYVSFKTTDSSDWITVKQSEFGERSIKTADFYSDHVYMPMYLNQNWGKDKTVTAIRIAIKAKAGKIFDGMFNLNFVRANYDSRLIDNVFCFVSALKQYFEFTGDKQVLKDNIARYRKAVLFMVYNLEGQSGLVDLSKFVGHDGGVIGDGTGKTIESSYWDVLSLSPKSIYAQVLYYETLQCAIFLENALAAQNITVAWPTIKLFRTQSADFNLSVEKISALMEDVKANVQKPVDTASKTGFYDKNTGRFIEGFNMHGDVVDYGSTIFNNMAISAGLATDEQAKSVCKWINGDRKIEGDNAKGYKGKDMDDPDNCGIYDFEFAPRVTTKKNYSQYTQGHANEAKLVYGTSCQDGGAILYTSYYDLMARFKTNGIEDAYKRLTGIKEWYKKVYDYSAEDFGATDFYRAYYDDLGITLQGGNKAGSLGLDIEFLENAIVYSFVPFAFFGLEGTCDGCLSVTPSLPKDLKFWRMENLMFHNVRYDLQIGKKYVLIESVRGNTLNENIVLNFYYKGKNPSVYIDGEKIDKADYVFANNTVTVKTGFTAKKVEVK